MSILIIIELMFFFNKYFAFGNIFCFYKHFFFKKLSYPKGNKRQRQVIRRLKASASSMLFPASSIVTYGQEELGFERIQALVREGNRASICLCRKLGFLREVLLIILMQPGSNIPSPFL